MITFENFMISTEAVFKGCKTPKRKPDYISNSGSKYWYQENSRGKYIIRNSDHWVNIKKIGSNKIKKNCKSIATCMWHIKTNAPKNPYNSYCVSGKCYLKNFKKIK